jgi:acyl-CoA reductase-like NAD-dependent aldehyde dehydrogenase
VYVEASAYDAFVSALSTTVRALRVGAGESGDTEVTGVIRPSAQATLEAQRADAVARGATIAAESPCPTGTGGSFVSPTVLTNVPSDARVLREEPWRTPASSGCRPASGHATPRAARRSPAASRRGRWR